MRKIISVILLMMTPLCVLAQEGRIIRGNCLPDLDTENTAAARGTQKRLGGIMTDWDPQKTYRQAVVLMSFKDRDFSMENPREFYDSLFNYPGFNKGAGAGCVAEYFREQSGGMLNLQFDVYGPYKVAFNAKLNPKATADTQEYGKYQMIDATEKWLAEDTLRKNDIYAWNGNKNVNQVIFIYAGYSGNEDHELSYGHIWPNTGSFASILTYDDYWVFNYSCSGELHYNNKSWGIGTICHEFTHSLGLPDIYPTGSDNRLPLSVVDEWDLMDGGNFINDGWCPPCYSGMERMLMGWQSPIELTEPTTITDMRPLSEGGPVYMIRYTDNEYYLLENRQQTGWDAGVPGKGLMIWHVNYSKSWWGGNAVNNSLGSPNYSAVSADNLDYSSWETNMTSLSKKGAVIYSGCYQNKEKMNSYLLSTAPYPWTTDSTDFVNDQLTDTTTPASVMYNKNAAGNKFLSKAITNIRVSDDGLVSFDFMGGDPQPVEAVSKDMVQTTVYNLRGVCVGNRIESQRPGIYIIRYSDGTARKVVVK